MDKNEKKSCGRPPFPAGMARVKRLVVPLSPAEFLALKQTANKSRVTVSEIVRGILFQEVKNDNVLNQPPG